MGAAIHAESSCTFTQDYDFDGIPNSLDSCVYTYNANQRDSDADGL